MGDTSARFIAIGTEAFKGPLELTQFLGLDQPPIENDLALANRYNLLHCITTLLSIVKRCAIPEDPDRAARGGFVAALSESGNPVYRNPATPHIVPALPPFFAFLRCMNALYTSASIGLLNEVSK